MAEERLALRSVVMVGRANKTTVESTAAMRVPRTITKRITDLLILFLDPTSVKMICYHNVKRLTN
jgi:hypothetical protein